MTPESWQNIDIILDVLEKAGCCRDGYINAPEDHVANTLRDWLRSEKAASPKFMECVIEPGRLTDEQVAAGVAALQRSRSLSPIYLSDSALVYSIVYAVLLAHIPNPPPPKIGELTEIKQ